mgnify:CR=1 FL=1
MDVRLRRAGHCGRGDKALVSLGAADGPACTRAADVDCPIDARASRQVVGHRNTCGRIGARVGKRNGEADLRARGDARRVRGLVDRDARARHFRDAVAEVWGKPLTMNVSMPIAAVMLDLDFPAAAVKAVPILARTAGLLAHLAEEQQLPLGFHLARAAEEAVRYER